MTLDEAQSLFDSANSAEDVFGVGDWQPRYKELAKALHPDRHNGDHARAENLFKQLGIWKQLAESPLVFESNVRTYRAGKVLGTGDIAEVRYATDGADDFVLKIARTPGVGNMLAKEREILTQLREKAGETHYAAYYPPALETFALSDKRRVNVFAHAARQATAEQVRAKYPTGVDPRHTVWMFKRLLTAIGYAHRKEWVHGAVLPQHLLFQTDTHGLQLIDWTLAVQPGKRLIAAPALFREWYPPECRDKKPITAASDIFMAAECMCWLSGGDPLKKTFPATVPKPMRAFFQGCLLASPSMRGDDAWKLFEQFDDLARSLYGPPRFVVLEM
jgi:hypothetical protein